MHLVISDNIPQQSNTLLKRQIKLNKITFIAIIDTGSTCSIINTKTYEKLKEKPREKIGPKIRLMDRTLVKLDKVLTIEIDVDNEIIFQDFYLYDKLKYGVLFGLDFCRISGITINFSNIETFDWMKSDFISEKSKSDVRLKKEYFLCRESVQSVECHLSFNVGLGYFKPDKRITEEYQLVIQETLIETTDECSIIVYNPKSINVILFNNMKIGTLWSIVELRYIEENLLLDTEKDEKEFSSKDFIIGSSAEEEKLQVLDVLENNRDLFGDSVKQIGRAINVEHEINLTDSKPIKLKSYKHSPKEKEIIREQVKDMLDNGIIEESYSPYSFPVVLVRKKNGKIRFCVDYRKLNTVTIKDRHPLPLMNDAICTLSNSKYFSVLDLLSGYWNIYLREEDKEKTAFITPEGLYQFRVLPFGLCNAPATFQRYIQKVLSDPL